MGKYLSDQNQLGFFFEPDTYGAGSKPASPQWVGLVQEHTPTENTNVVQVRYQGSTDRNIDTFQQGANDFEGTFSYYPQDWRFLGFAIGSISDSIAAGSHVISETNSDDLIYGGSTLSMPSFTLEDSKDYGTVGSNFIRTYKGCMINTFTVNLVPGEIVNCEVNYMAQAGSVGSGAIVTVAPTTTVPYMWSDTVLQIPNGTTVPGVKDLTLTINNNLERGHYLSGSKVAKELLPLNRDIELSVSLNADNAWTKTLYNHFTSGTTFNTSLECVGQAGSLFVTMSGCGITDMEVPSLVEGLQEQTCTIVPQHISAIAYDAVAKYYAR